MRYIVLADGTNGNVDRYAVGPFDTHADAERGVMEEAAQQGAFGHMDYRNSIVPLREGK